MQQRVLLGAGVVALVVIGAIAMRGVRHEAGHVADQNIGQLLANLPPGYAVKHGPVDYNPLTGTATLHDVEVARDNGVKWVADTVTLSLADSQALRDVIDPAAYPNGKPAWTDRRLLLNDAAAHGVRATVPGSKELQYTIRSVSLHRLSGRPFALPPTPENRQMPGFWADAALALAADSVTETDTVMDLSGDARAKITIASMAGSNYDGGKLGSLLVKDVALDTHPQRGGPVHATVASLSIKDADLRPALRRHLSGTEAASSGMSGVSYSSADLDGLAMDGGGLATMQWKELHAEQTAPDSSGARSGVGYLHGMTIGTGSAPLPANLANALDAFGMRSVTADIDGKSHGVAGGTSEVSENIALHDLGTLHVTASFSGYQPPASTAAPVAMLALMRVTLQHASLVWDDASLVSRTFKLAAEQSHTTPELVRGQLAMPLLALGAMLPDQPDAADQLSAFLEHPHTLSVTMAPQPPVSFAEVGQAPVTARAHMLGVHIAGN